MPSILKTAPARYFSFLLSPSDWTDPQKNFFQQCSFSNFSGKCSLVSFFLFRHQFFYGTTMNFDSRPLLHSPSTCFSSSKFKWVYLPEICISIGIFPTNDMASGKNYFSSDPTWFRNSREICPRDCRHPVGYQWSVFPFRHWNWLSSRGLISFATWVIWCAKGLCLPDKFRGNAPLFNRQVKLVAKYL